MSVPHRCSRRACRQRITLAKPITDYVRVPVCPSCGHNSLKPDYSRKAYNRKHRCTCDGAPWPHRKGSIPFCTHYAGTPTDEDYQQLYAIGR
jgi:hypothetical protein